MLIPAAISAIRRVSPTVKEFTLDTGGEQLVFRAGQWLDCHVEIDGQSLVGGYSLTSSPLTPGRVELAIKQSQENPVTRFLHERANVGQVVGLVGGQGGCYFEAGMAQSLVLVAGGIGVTPLISILRYVREAAPEVRVTMIYSAGSTAELLFRDELELMSASSDRIRCEFTVTLDVDHRAPGDRSGRIDPPMLREIGIDRDALCYVCGPAEMIDDVSRSLVEVGVDPSRIRFEKWW